jgi:hypothetical protein
MARRIDDALVNKLTTWAERLTARMEGKHTTPEPLGALQMIRREAIDQWQNSDPSQLEVSHISHQQMTSPKLIERRLRLGNLKAD